MDAIEAIEPARKDAQAKPAKVRRCRYQDGPLCLSHSRALKVCLACLARKTARMGQETARTVATCQELGRQLEALQGQHKPLKGHGAETRQDATKQEGAAA